MNSIDIIGDYGRRVDAPAEQLLSSTSSSMYGMLRYFMGYADEHFLPVHSSVGRRMRPGILLYVADAYGALEAAVPAALSVELFHNFSLIHDDIEDHDELRRGRPTVWKIWGVNQAINAGDAQLVLSMQALRQGNLLQESTYIELEQFLFAQYLKVAEGQHMDFLLTEASLEDRDVVSEEKYLEMIQKKTAELIAAALKVGGLVSGSGVENQEHLYQFGLSIGIAYQLNDDRQSIWGATSETGKREAGDIVERKKTLPVLYARDALPALDQSRLVALYENTKDECAEEIITLLDATDAQGYLSKKIAFYKNSALDSLRHTNLPDQHKRVLESLAHELIP
jgi:geranylgeranyl diphosphate synthase type I